LGSTENSLLEESLSGKTAYFPAEIFDLAALSGKIADFPAEMHNLTDLSVQGNGHIRG